MASKLSFLCVLVFSIGLVAAVGCGGSDMSPQTTEADALDQYLEENPDVANEVLEEDDESEEE